MGSRSSRIRIGCLCDRGGAASSRLLQTHPYGKVLRKGDRTFRASAATEELDQKRHKFSKLWASGQEAVKSVAVIAICGFLYVRFLTSPVLDVLSMRQWSIIGLAVAIVSGSVCRLLIRNGTVMGLSAVSALIEWERSRSSPAGI